MFASRASGEFAYAHHLQFENISFDANRENQDGGVYDILHIDGGGYNCELRNVSFRACTGWAIHCKEKLINFVLYDVTGTNCGQYPSIADGYDPDLHGGFIYFDYNLVAGSDTFAHYGGQLDSCGRYPYFFSHNKEIGGSHIFDSIELEGVGGSGTHGAHIAMVGYQTNNTVATDPLGRGRSTIWIRGVRSDNVNLSGDPTVPDPTALVHVIAGDTEPDIIISDIRSSGTNILYQNDPLGITVDNVSSDNYVAFWTNSGRVWAPRILLTGGVYANDAAAGAAGLVADDLYKDGSGHIKYKL
jgi:hypothetical protein